MSYEEEDTCHMTSSLFFAHLMVLGDEEEDTCHMRRRIHVI